MFVEHLIATLVSPLGSPLSRWDRWQLPVDRYRGQLTQKACALSASGELDAETTSWVLRCVAEGWLDAYLSDLRDGLPSRPFIGDEDYIGWLQVSVNDVLSVYISQGIGYLQDNLHGSFRAEFFQDSQLFF